MDNTNATTQQTRKGSHLNDDRVGGCCLVFNRARRKKDNRCQSLRCRKREGVPKKAQAKSGDGRTPEGEASRSPDPISATRHADMEIPRTTPPPDSVDVETEEFQNIISSAITELNKSIAKFYSTLIEFDDTSEYNEGTHTNNVPLECRSLEEGMNLVCRIIHNVIGKQKQAREATGSERGALDIIGRGLVIICQGIKPALKNFLRVAAASSNVSVVKDYSLLPLTFCN
jgi:hypothetical protein